MNNGNMPPAAGGRWYARLWRLVSRPTARYSLGTLLVAGAAIGVVFWGGFNWAMELTNTETFCVSCHEMEQNTYREYRGSVHDANASGVRATCPDCHVPREWVHTVARKIQATNELDHHFLGSVSTRERFEAKRLQLAKNVWNVMLRTDSRECRNCHNFDSMDFPAQQPRAQNRHPEALAQGKTCIDCHKGIAHELPAGALEAERELEQASRSLRELRKAKAQ